MSMPRGEVIPGKHEGETEAPLLIEHSLCQELFTRTSSALWTGIKPILQIKKQRLRERKPQPRLLALLPQQASSLPTSALCPRSRVVLWCLRQGRAKGAAQGPRGARGGGGGGGPGVVP